MFLSRVLQQLCDIEFTIRSRHLHFDRLQHQRMKNTETTNTNTREVGFLGFFGEIVKNQLNTAAREEGVVSIFSFISNDLINALDSGGEKFFELLVVSLLVNT